MNTPHTPGPWRYDASRGIVSPTTDRTVAMLNYSAADSLRQEEANGHLLAAAPALLNAAELALDALGTLGRFGPHAAAVHALRDAIAAARMPLLGGVSEQSKQVKAAAFVEKQCAAPVSSHDQNPHTGA